MARIYTYPNDTALRDEDAWIGTNYPDLATVQFTAKKIADYLNFNGRISVAGHLVYKYNYAQQSVAGTISVQSGGSSIAFSAITELYIHQNDLSEQLTSNFLGVLVGKEILLAQANDINNFGHYSINSLTASGVNPEFYILGLTHLNSNGNLSEDSIYNIIQFNLSADKHYTHTQNIVSDTWTINHNLNKKPLVTVVNSIDKVVHGEIDYVTSNSLTITFIGGFTGKAYLN